MIVERNLKYYLHTPVFYLLQDGGSQLGSSEGRCSEPKASRNAEPCAEPSRRSGPGGLCQRHWELLLRDRYHELSKPELL